MVISDIEQLSDDTPNRFDDEKLNVTKENLTLSFTEQAFSNSILKSMSNKTNFLLAKKTAHYLKSELASEITLNDLARKMATNRNKLSSAFKTCFGTTVFNWLKEQRMLYAAELLISTSQTILQIAEKVGYPDSNNFSTAFKRLFQLSPMQYRKMQKTKIFVREAKVKHESVQVI
jgi:AraC-like DNA-binding protein